MIKDRVIITIVGTIITCNSKILYLIVSLDLAYPSLILEQYAN